MTTTPVPSITDEQIAEIEACMGREFSEIRSVELRALISRLRAAERGLSCARDMAEQEYRWRLEDSECGGCEVEEGVSMLHHKIDTAMKGEQQ